MKLIIDISDKTYEIIKNMVYFCNSQRSGREITKEILNAIKQGIPLPKGHGDLIDRDKLVYDCSLGGGGCDHICRCDGCLYNIIRETTINKATPIIKADKGEQK